MVLAEVWAVDLWLPGLLAAVAAVALTRLTAGIDRRAWERDARRDAYARFLGSANVLTHLWLQVGILDEEGRRDDDVSRSALQEYAALSVSLAEVRLYGGPEVVKAAELVADQRIRAASDGVDGQWLASVEALASAMRTDLGIPDGRPGALGGLRGRRAPRRPSPE